MPDPDKAVNMENTPDPLRVLYVEDDPDIRVIARIALEDLGGFDVRTCESGEEALRAIAGFQPDLLLLDVMMPGMDGPTLLSHLRKTENGATAPAIFMTARVQRSEIDQYLGLGALSVIAKPFDPLTLADLIQQTLAEVK